MKPYFGKRLDGTGPEELNIAFDDMESVRLQFLEELRDLADKVDLTLPVCRSSLDPDILFIDKNIYLIEIFAMYGAILTTGCVCNKNEIYRSAVTLFSD
ncbi:hypothetical protein [Mucilaginibacter gynuensis]